MGKGLEGPHEVSLEVTEGKLIKDCILIPRGSSNPCSL